MTKNKDFMQVIVEMPFVIQADGLKEEQIAEKETARRSALDAILLADPKDIPQFRRAISSHLAFWQQHKTLGIQNQTIDDINTKDTILKSDDAPSFQQLQKIAAEKRILLGLQKADDDVFVAILQNNPDECREYLASKSSFGPLTQMPTWPVPAPVVDANAPAPVAPKPGSEILDEAVILGVKKRAAELLLINKIQQSDDLESLKGLLGAAQAIDYQSYAKKMGFPDNQQALEILVGSRDALKETLKNRVYKVSLKKVKKDYETRVKGWSREEVLSQEQALKLSDNRFKQQLNFEEDISEDDVHWAKGVAGKRYLETWLPDNAIEDQLLAIINEAEVEATIEKVKTFVDDDDYIKYAITKDSLFSFKIPLIIKIMNQQTDLKKISTLAQTSNLQDFKTALIGIGITQTSVFKEAAHMEELQKAARSHYFKLILDKKSPLGAAAHPQLIAVFQALKPEKQVELLQDNNNEIRHILNAQDNASVAYYFKDVDPDLLAKVTAENKDCALFRDIHNAVVARMLVQIKPPITLTSEAVEGINKALHEHRQHAEGFTDFEQYAQLVHAIKTQCGRVNEADFFKQFGVKENQLSGTVPGAIGAQQQHNTELETKYYQENQADYYKQFLGILSGVEKECTINEADLHKIESALMQASSLNDFNEKLLKINPNDKKFQAFVANLANTLTSAHFNKIRAGAKKAVFEESKKPEHVKAVFANLSKDFEILEKRQNELEDKLKQHKPLLKVLPVHLFNPSFHEKVKTQAQQMKAQYEDMAQDCALILDQSRRDILVLQSYLQSISKKNKMTHAIEQRIKFTLMQAKSNLRYYKQVQEKLIGHDGILKAIDAMGSKSYYYQSSEIKRHPPRSIGTPLPLPAAGTAIHNANPTAASTSSPSAPYFADKMKSNEAVDYDVTHQVDVANDRKVVLFGRYTETHPDTVDNIVTMNADGTSTKRYASKFEMTEFPKKQPGVSNDQLKTARVNYSMSMGVSILANMDEPPTKDNPIYLTGDNEEELRHLWTALVILGEKDPNKRFDRSAIEVISSAFNPESERTAIFGIGFFSSDSLYKSDFLGKNEALVNVKVNDSKSISQEKSGQKKESSVQAQKSMQAMKSSVKNMKQAPAEVLKSEGPAPEDEVERPSHVRS